MKWSKFAFLLVFQLFWNPLSLLAQSSSDIGNALDNTTLIWSTDGDVPWVVQTKDTHLGSSAMQSGGITSIEQSKLNTFVTGPGALTFWYKSTQASYDSYLQFSINGEFLQNLPLTLDWTNATICVPAGDCSLCWTYSHGVYLNETFILMDEVVFVPGGVAPIITASPSSITVLENDPLQLTAQAIGTLPLSYQWRLNGVPIPDATNTSLAISKATAATNDGIYDIVVTNAYGSATSGAAIVNVLNFGKVLGATNFVWTTSGSALWFIQTNTSIVGPIMSNTALQSGYISSVATSTIQTTITGPGELDFSWGTSCMTNSSLRMLVDGALRRQISGKVNKTTSTVYLPDGTHVVAWTFARGSAGFGNNAGYLDHISFTSGTTELKIDPLSDQYAMAGGNVTFGTIIRGTGAYGIQWQHAGTNLPNATNETLVLTNITPGDAGVYRLTVSDNSENAAVEAGLFILPVAEVGIKYAEMDFSAYPGGTNTITVLTNVISVTEGTAHALGIKADSTICSWGYIPTNLVSKQLEVLTNPPGATNIIAIAAGNYFNAALRKDGTLFTWGNIAPKTVTGASNYTAIAAGKEFLLAVDQRGTVSSFGTPSADPYSSTIPTGLNRVVDVAVGLKFGMALKDDGTVMTWRYSAPSFSGVSNIVAIAANNSSGYALKLDGTVTGSGISTSEKAFLATLTNVVAIRAFAGNAAALTADGRLSVWGDNTYQQTNVPSWATNVTDFAVGDGRLAVVLGDAKPIIVSPMLDRMVIKGDTASFRVKVVGALLVAYQWQHDGVDIPGATNASLVIRNVGSNDLGGYRVIVASGTETVMSREARLSFYDLGSAAGQPDWVWTNDPIYPMTPETTNIHNGGAALSAYGNAATLRTVVDGPGLLTFWWWRTASSSSGTFYVDNIAQASASYSLSWLQKTVYLAAGRHELKWVFRNSSISSLSLVQMGFLGDIQYVPDVVTAPVISAQPTSQTNTAGNTLTLSVSAYGTPNLRYQWLLNATSIPGATNSTLTFSPAWAKDSGVYSVSVGNDYGSVLSSNAVLYVLDTAPVITTQPAGGFVREGDSITFTAAAIGSLPIQNQWLWNGIPMAGQTNLTLILTNIQNANAGNYSFSAVNPFGSVISSNAVLVVFADADLGAALDLPQVQWSATNVSWFPQTTTTHDGVSAAQSGTISGSQRSTLRCVVTGPVILTYWWQVNCDSFWDALASSVDGTVQNSITGSNNWQMATNYIGAGSHVVEWTLYPVNGSFAGGTAWLDQVSFTPGGLAPTFTTQPTGGSVPAGNSLSLNSSAIGTAPLFYQWKFNGSDIPGATNATLKYMSVQSDASGTYGVVVSNNFGSAVSSNAVVVVKERAPVITQSPVSQPINIGGAIQLYANASGSLPMNLQWYHDGDPIDGAATSPLTVTNIQTADGGNYYAIFNNAYGASTTSVARVQVAAVAVLDYWTTLSSPSQIVYYWDTNLVAVAAGSLFTIGIRNDGTVAAWGSGMATNTPAGLSNVVAVAAGDYHAVALKEDGTVVVWGDDFYGEAEVPDGLTNVISIAASALYTLALRNDGTVVGWGYNEFGHLNIPDGLTDVDSISASPENGFALKTDGTVVQWGLDFSVVSNGVSVPVNFAGRMSGVDTVVGNFGYGWTLQDDGTLQSWNTTRSASDTNSILKAVTPGDISSIYRNVIAMKSDGSLNWVDFWHYYRLPVEPSGAFDCSAASEHLVLLLGDGSPRIVPGRRHRTAQSGQTITLSSRIVGASPMSYQWSRNGAAIANATNCFLPLPEVTPVDAGVYTCVGSNDRGSVTNHALTVSIERTAPVLDVTPNRADGTINMRIRRLAGHGDVVVLTSTDLVNWTPVCTNAPTTGDVLFTDSAPLEHQARFYKAMER